MPNIAKGVHSGTLQPRDSAHVQRSRRDARTPETEPFAGFRGFAWETVIAGHRWPAPIAAPRPADARPARM
jgi:hypothetical protein